MHLNADQLVDLAEGAQPEATAPHLAECETCRAQLQELRAMMSAASEVAVPEPSPLFWDHLSMRVRDAVAMESAPRRSWFDVAAWKRLLMPLSVVMAAGLVIALVVNSRATAPAPISTPSVAVAGAATELLNDLAADDDASLTLVASLTDEVDLDTAREAGLAPRGSAEHAVTHMSDGELRELGRLLKEELARSGA
jgi:hypothetical protein